MSRNAFAPTSAFGLRLLVLVLHAYASGAVADYDGSATGVRRCAAAPHAAVLLFGALRDTAHTRFTYQPNVLAPLEALTGSPVDVFVHVMLTDAIVVERNGEHARDLAPVSREQMEARLGPACDFADDKQSVVDASELRWARAWSIRDLNALRAWYVPRAHMRTARPLVTNRVFTTNLRAPGH